MVMKELQNSMVDKKSDISLIYILLQGNLLMVQPSYFQNKLAIIEIAIKGGEILFFPPFTEGVSFYQSSLEADFGSVTFLFPAIRDAGTDRNQHEPCIVHASPVQGFSDTALLKHFSSNLYLLLFPSWAFRSGG